MINFEPDIRKLFSACDADTTFRAINFYRQACLMPLRGWQDPYNSFLLSIEPQHPYREDYLSTRFKALGYGDSSMDKLRSAGFTILNLPLIEMYIKSLILLSPYEHIFGKTESPEGDYLCDHFYGFVFWKEKDVYRNSIISREDIVRLRRSPIPLVRVLADLGPASHLAQGVFIAALLFGNHFGPNVRKAYDLSEVPEIIVSSETEYLNLIDKLRNLTLIPNLELWFRGQTQDYLMPSRDELFSSGMVPYGDVQDSSLVSSLHRVVDRFYGSVSEFQNLVDELDWWWKIAINSVPLPFTTRYPWQDAQEPAPNIPGVNLSSTMNIIDKGTGEVIPQITKDFHHKLHNAQRGLILQHYGCPTGWIDITSDPSIALWFAMNKLTLTSVGTNYTGFNWSNVPSSSWPTIYVFPLIQGHHPFIDTHTILQGTEALRPERQKCGLLGGSCNLARNYAARFIGLKIKLAPNLTTSTSINAGYLFPRSDEDECLKKLLAHKRDNPKFPVFWLL